ncbi:hypothetical protein RCL_jg23516.t1 [Rhizophagus clarus]|uniref:Uncharacterized protein n=1 Tax=Rhizophagus clarus TaxID=94130 RepID=A0A8H3QH87_9GLOM|nr:hypothetical protein RCL_jg23516.t1 [Rhizophagus clarus]
MIYQTGKRKWGKSLIGTGSWILALACCEKGMVEAEVPTAEDGLRAGTTGGGEETKSGKRGLRGCEGGVPLREFLTKEG